MIKEASCSFQINPQFVGPAYSVSLVSNVRVEAMVKSGVVGDDEANKDDMDNINWSKVNRVDMARLEDEVRETPNFEIQDGNGKRSDSNKSRSKSTSGQASINNCSEGIIKISQKALASQNIEASAHSGLQANKMGRSATLSSSLSTKTKTTQLSGNGYSEELAKIYQHDPPYDEMEMRGCNSSWYNTPHCDPKKESLQVLYLPMCSVMNWKHPQALTS